MASPVQQLPQAYQAIEIEAMAATSEQSYGVW